MSCVLLLFLFFFFNDTATTEIYTLSLHDALPIFLRPLLPREHLPQHEVGVELVRALLRVASKGLPGLVQLPLLRDRKSTRLNSSHGYISYAVFCLKKKKQSKPYIYRE